MHQLANSAGCGEGVRRQPDAADPAERLGRDPRAAKVRIRIVSVVSVVSVASEVRMVSVVTEVTNRGKCGKCGKCGRVWQSVAECGSVW